MLPEEVDTHQTFPSSEKSPPAQAFVHSTENSGERDRRGPRAKRGQPGCPSGPGSALDLQPFPSGSLGSSRKNEAFTAWSGGWGLPLVGWSRGLWLGNGSSGKHFK